MKTAFNLLGTVVFPVLCLLLLFRNSSEIKALSSRIDSLEGLMTGHQHMPEAWVEQLTDVETSLKYPKKWPQSSQEANEFLSNLSNIIGQLSPPAEAVYIQRINPLRWSAMAFVLLHSGTQDLTTAAGINEQIDTLLSEIPEGVSGNLPELLERHASDLNRKQSEAELLEILGRVIMFFRSESASSPSRQNLDEMNRCLEILTSHSDSEPKSTEIVDTCKSIHTWLILSEAKEEAINLNKRWEASKSLEANDPDLYRDALDSFLESARSARLALALEGIPISDLNQLEKRLIDARTHIANDERKQLKERFTKASSDYQKTTLKRIGSFKHKYYDGISQKDDESGLLLIRDAMVLELGPVNTSLLEISVAELYNQMFQLGWRKLDGMKHQSYVAKAMALKEKEDLKYE